MPISLASEISVPTPYLPMVKAIAPKAPMGATFMTMPTMPNSTWDSFSIKSKTGLPLRAERVEREAEEEREKQHLQHVALGKGADHAVRDDVEQEVHRALHLPGLRVLRDRLGIEAGGIDVHPGAGLDDVHDHQTDDERERAHDLEVEQRVAAGLADRLHVLHAGDADDDRAEDDRRDDHLDELDEPVAEGLHRGAGLREEVPEQDADDDSDDHLEIERLVAPLLGRCAGVMRVCHFASSLKSFTPLTDCSRLLLRRHAEQPKPFLPAGAEDAAIPARGQAR